jgi:putative intracellular protease/amidase
VSSNGNGHFQKSESDQPFTRFDGENFSLENAGATFIDEPVVTDGNIVTSRGPLDIAAFIYAIDKLLLKRATK